MHCDGFYFTPQVENPEELAIRVFIILLEHTVARGSTTPAQIRRSYISVQHDSQGRRTVRVHGNAERKNMQGRNENYKPIDVKVFGELEVRLAAINGLVALCWLWLKGGIQSFEIVRPALVFYLAFKLLFKLVYKLVFKLGLKLVSNGSYSHLMIIFPTNIFRSLDMG